jgi:hypothetical protein
MCKLGVVCTNEVVEEKCFARLLQVMHGWSFPCTFSGYLGMATVYTITIRAASSSLCNYYLQQEEVYVATL